MILFILAFKIYFIILSFVSVTLYFVSGGVYLLYHVFIQKSIEWEDFNLGEVDGDLLQIGLGLFSLQVGKMKIEKNEEGIQRVDTSSKAANICGNAP